MATRLRTERGRPGQQTLEDALVADHRTATYAAAFATLCAKLASAEAEPGDAFIAVRLAQQTEAAARAFHCGQRLPLEVWIGEDAREN